MFCLYHFRAKIHVVISTLIQYIEEMKSDSILLENFTLICLGANPFCDMMDGISFSCELK